MQYMGGMTGNQNLGFPLLAYEPFTAVHLVHPIQHSARGGRSLCSFQERFDAHLDGNFHSSIGRVPFRLRVGRIEERHAWVHPPSDSRCWSTVLITGSSFI